MKTLLFLIGIALFCSIPAQGQTIYLEQVVKINNECYIHTYGYSSENDTVVPPSKSNYFLADRVVYDLSQPVVFKKGRHRAVFSVMWTSPIIRWMVNGQPELRKTTKYNYKL